MNAERRIQNSEFYSRYPDVGNIEWRVANDDGKVRQRCQGWRWSGRGIYFEDSGRKSPPQKKNATGENLLTGIVRGRGYID